MDLMMFKGPIASLMAVSIGMLTVVSAQAQDRPATTNNAPQNPALKSPDVMVWTDLAKGHNSFTQREAVSRFRKAGYTDVSTPMLDEEGLWQATASNHGKPVHVALDYKGNLAER
jgi:hypothetical protein